eukprot:COSAG01_NODE_113_length_25617_cov_10.523492_24_plen_267_part_00
MDALRCCEDCAGLLRQHERRRSSQQCDGPAGSAVAAAAAKFTTQLARPSLERMLERAAEDSVFGIAARKLLLWRSQLLGLDGKHCDAKHLNNVLAGLACQWVDATADCQQGLVTTAKAVAAGGSGGDVAASLGAAATALLIRTGPKGGAMAWRRLRLRQAATHDALAAEACGTAGDSGDSSDATIAMGAGDGVNDDDADGGDGGDDDDVVDEMHSVNLEARAPPSHQLELGHGALDIHCMAVTAVPPPEQRHPDHNPDLTENSQSF